MTRRARPLERVEGCLDIDREQVRALQQVRAQLDPIALAARIDEQLTDVYRLANQRVSPAAPTNTPRVDAPDLWTHRPRPEGPWKLQNGFHSAHTPLLLQRLR